MGQVDLTKLVLAVGAGIGTVLVFAVLDLLIFGPALGTLGAGIAGGLAGVFGSVFVNRRRFSGDS